MNDVASEIGVSPDSLVSNLVGILNSMIFSYL